MLALSGYETSGSGIWTAPSTKDCVLVVETRAARSLHASPSPLASSSECAHPCPHAHTQAQATYPEPKVGNGVGRRTHRSKQSGQYVSPLSASNSSTSVTTGALLSRPLSASALLAFKWGQE